MILTHAELESLVRAQHRHPHQLLGMHPLGDGSGVVVRAYLHNAAHVEAAPALEKFRPRLKLERVHESGLFEGVTREANRISFRREEFVKGREVRGVLRRDDGQPEAGARIVKAIEQVLSAGKTKTAGLGGTANTKAMTAALTTNWAPRCAASTGSPA